jgi:hypothetical protein
MHRKVLLGGIAALGAAFAADAQVGAPPAGRPIPGAPPAAAVNPPTTAGLKAGMVVKDTNGAVVGAISKVGQTPDGRPSVTLQVEGRQVAVLAASLSADQGGKQAVSSQTRAQLLASASAPPPVGLGQAPKR